MTTVSPVACSKAASALILCALVLFGPALAAEAEDSPVLWPERDRAFFTDGPGLLLDRDERDALRRMDPAARATWIAGFLSEDPVPETPLNELVDGIEKRRALVFQEFNSFVDDRSKAIFLHGLPTERRQVECGQTFQPIEVWTYPEPVSRHRLVFYRRGPEGPHRLWIPLDSKRALYNKDMAYWLQQYEELRRFIQGKRFDIQACDDALFIDAVTGVAGLSGHREGRPTNDELLDLLRPPADRSAWAAEAARTALPETPTALELGDVEFFFPERRGQRTVVRALLTVPMDAELGLVEGGEDLAPQHRLTVEGTVEQDGTLFETYRVRFKLPPPTREVPIGLAVERALRSERAYLLRFKVIDEVSGAVVHAAKGTWVPTQTQRGDTALTKDLIVVEIDRELAESRIAGEDSLLLAPPDGRLALGTWRAEALVSGIRIAEVVFSVDGYPQVRRKQSPFTVDLRLSEYPTEQVIRAEGFDADGELVAFDEVVLNQPRGSFSVRITSPRKDEKVSGRIPVWAEVTIPDERIIERVDFLLNDELLQTLDDDPWRIMVDVPDQADVETAYLTVAATLDDGTRAEAVRFLNSPEFLETLEVNLVEMLATVLDKSGRPVAGLGASDFKVLEDGRAQAIDRFEHVQNLPLSIGITIDTSGSMATALPEAQKAAVGFLRNVMSPTDSAFLVSFARETALLVPPTDDLRAVEASLEGLQSIGWTALHDAVVTSLYYFRGFRGQRALILLSDGDDSASHYAFRDALEYARRSGVVVYTVGLNVGTLKTGIRGKLNRLASETGGRSFFIKQASELAGVYNEIEDELRSQYFIAYNSDNSSGDEEFRTIDLVVQGGKLKARTLRGYYPK
ncbi:MAG: VWA domain-containing protein [Thermoanaerobaculia bacterium]